MNKYFNFICHLSIIAECVPPSLRFFSGNEQVDLARKMQEDRSLIRDKEKGNGDQKSVVKKSSKIKAIKTVGK